MPRFDTRRDPSFPGNAVYLGAGWSALNVQGAERINRYQTDARGYLRVIRQAVVAGRVQYFTTDATLPRIRTSAARRIGEPARIPDRHVHRRSHARYVRRAARAAHVGAARREARRVGVHGRRRRSATSARASRMPNGIAGPAAASSSSRPLVKLNFDIAHGFDGGGTRLNLGTGFSF